MELIRYIHLNPIRAGTIEDLDHLDAYGYTGHSALMGKMARKWQDIPYVLNFFSNNVSRSRRHYRKFIEQGIDQGRRPNLTGGGLIRSLGGWSAAKMQRNAADRIKSDERILGDGGFVEAVLHDAKERLDNRYALISAGMDLQAIAERVGKVFKMNPDTVWKKGKRSEIVKARSLFCYWAVRDLGVTNRSLAEKLGLTQPAVSISVGRGEKIADELKVKLIEE